MPLVTADGFFGPVDFKFNRSTGELIGKLSGSPLRKESSKIKTFADEAATKLAYSIRATKIRWA